MEKPYIKELMPHEGFKIFIVDGKYIRTNINEEFTNFGQHADFKFIPEGEFWVDEEHGKERDEEFYIKSMLAENKLLREKLPYQKASKTSEIAEKKVRLKKDSKKIKSLIKNKERAIKRIHIGILRETPEIKIWLVDGALVRDLYYINFTEGGHDLVYKFVPENEVWIDDDLKEEERKFVILHELHERNLMAEGMRYNKAHQRSSIAELKCRRKPEKTDDVIERELRKIKHRKP